MNETVIEDRPDVTSGTPWSEMDLFDLANSLKLKDPIEEIASFVCRSRLAWRQSPSPRRSIARCRPAKASWPRASSGGR
jgi:hypothetical protein